VHVLIGVPAADDLKHIWFCRVCKKTFVFASDIEDHTRVTGHDQMTRISFDEFKPP
jgi:hypothetical protein